MPEVLASNLFKVCSNKVSAFKFTFHAELFEEKTKSNYSRERSSRQRESGGDAARRVTLQSQCSVITKQSVSADGEHV